MAKTYRIDVNLNNRQAISAARALNAELAKLDKAAAASATRAQQQINRSGGGGSAGGGGRGGAGGGGGLFAQHRIRLAMQRQMDQDEDRWFKRDYDRRVAYERKKEMEQARAANKAATAKQKDGDRLATIEDRHLKREYSQRVAYERKRDQEQARATNRAIASKEREKQQLQAIEDKWSRREQRERTRFERNKIESAAGAADAKQARTEQMIDRGGMLAVGAAVAGLTAFFGAIDQVRERAIAGADALYEYRRNLRVDAAIKGSDQSDNKALKENLQLRVASGLSSQEASDFERMFESAVPIGLQKGNISRETADKLKVAAAIRANRRGGDAYTHGELAGLLGQFSKVTNEEQGLGQLEVIRHALVEGRGDDTPLSRQLLKTAGSMVREGGAVGTLPELAALISVTSVTAGTEEAGTRAEQLNRALRSGLTKHRKGAGTVSSQADYLKKIGITEHDNLETMIDKINVDVSKATAAGRDPETYLGERGFRAFEERRAIVETLHNYDAFKVRMANVREMSKTQAATETKANAAFQQSPEGRMGIAAAVGDANKAAIDMKTERWNALLKEAEASKEFQESERSVLSWATNIGVGLGTGHIGDPLGAGKQFRLEGIAHEKLKARAKSVGITDTEMMEAMRASYGAPGGDTGRDAEYANRVEEMIAKKGGQVGVETVDAMKNLQQSIDESNRLTKMMLTKDGVGQAPPALPAAPRGGPVRPGG